MRRFLGQGPLAQNFLGLVFALVLLIAFALILRTTWEHWRVAGDYTTGQAATSFGIACVAALLAILVLIFTLRT